MGIVGTPRRVSASMQLSSRAENEFRMKGFDKRAKKVVLTVKHDEQTYKLDTWALATAEALGRHIGKCPRPLSLVAVLKTN